MDVCHSWTTEALLSICSNITLCVLFLLCFEIHWLLRATHIPYARNEYYGTRIAFKAVSLTHKCMLSAELLCLVGNFPFVPLLCGGSVPSLCADSLLPAAAVHLTTCSRNSHQVTHPQPLLLAGTSAAAAAAWVTGRIKPPAASLMLYHTRKTPGGSRSLGGLW